uniref:uncharacterized protein LOC122588134 n=1 Tax=Erigeron canadensis TaxID=72917 RepID=UPI001CB93EC0|nr:uncharacterized protein LOC122588134 [Erigeron canadensis]
MESPDSRTIAGIDPQDWNKHVDFFVSEGYVRRSQVNKANRALQSNIPTQGRTSFAQRQRGIFGPITAYPSLFATWAESHQHEDGSWTSELRAKQHADMLTRWDETRNDDNPPTEAE